MILGNGSSVTFRVPKPTFTVANPTAGPGVRFVPTAGPQGATGPAGGTYLTHAQPTPAGTWSFTHTLGRYPNVELLDPSGVVIDSDITATTTQVVVTFATPTAGYAVLT